MTSRRVLIPVVAALLLSACLSDNSDSSDPGNIKAEALTVVTPDPRIADPMKATISLNADQAMSDVPVSLFATEKTDDPNADVRQIPLGEAVLEQVTVGTHDYDLEVIVPASVEFTGPYYLSAFVDPANIISESNKDDNSAATEMVLADSSGPNILLADVALDRTALIINTDDYVTPTADNTYNADAGGTITVGADGLALGESVDIIAFASLRISRSDNGTSLDMPLYLWNTAEGRYTNAYGIDPDTGATVDIEWLPLGEFTPLLAETADSEVALDDVRRDSEHMEFYFPGKLGSELEQALRYPPQPCTSQPCALDDSQPTIPPPDLTAAAISEMRNFLDGLPFSGVLGDESDGMAALDFDICVKIRSTDPMASDRSEADNEVCKPLDIFLPPLPEQSPLYDIAGYTQQFTTPALALDKSDGFATTNSNPYFAMNVDFGAGASADDRGFIAYVSADLPVQVFGGEFDFVGITVNAQLVPDYVNKPASEISAYSSEIRFLGLALDVVLPVTPWVSYEQLGNLELIPTDISYSKEVLKEQQFFVGPVPMVAGGSIGGNIGLSYSIGYSDNAPPVLGGGNEVVSMGVSIGPFTNLEAGLSIGVGIKVGVTAGVEGVLTLVDERLVYFIGTDIEVIDDGFSSGDVEFIIIPGQKLSNIFTGPKGALNLFVKYPTFKWTTCKAGVVKYKCIKYDKVKRKLNLYTTPALFQREDVLFENPFVQLDVVKVSGKPTAYFIP
jgi:hypothetical protein